MNSKRILVTGASGFVGAWLSKLYLDSGYEVISIMHDIHPISTDKLLKITDDITWAYGDVTDAQFVQRVIADYEVDEIIHGAALPIERVSFRAISPIFNTNVMGTINILEALKQINDNGFPLKMLYISSDKAYGNLGEREYLETDFFNPTSVYSCSKSCADLSSTAFAKTYDLPISVVRPSNLYGGYDLNSRIIPNTIRECLNGKSPILYSGLTSLREYTYITDGTRALKLILDNTKSGEVYNIGSGDLRDQENVVLEIIKYFPETHLVHRIPEFYKKIEIPYQKVNAEKIKRELGWIPTVSFEKGIKLTIEDERAWKTNLKIK